MSLNSLYGKFGTDPVKDKHVIVDSVKADYYLDKFIVTRQINLGNNKELILTLNQLLKLMKTISLLTKTHPYL